jgi:4-hydroxy-4-methyl-2-oxoglutarate aldolase
MAAVPALSNDALAFFRGVPSSIVTDSLFRFGLGSWMDDVLPVNRGWQVAGRVRTLCYAPKSGVKHANHTLYSVCEAVAPGDVIVVATGGTRGWIMGENIAHFCLNHGLGGIVTDGRVRDSLELAGLDLPVFSRGTSARPFRMDVDVVAFDTPVECGGAYLRPGDLVVGDVDGVVVVPHELADALVIEAEEIMALEKEQEIAIRDRAPRSVIDDISRRKKIRKGPAFDPAARR